MRKIPIFRIIFSIIAAVLIVFGVYCLFGGFVEWYNVRVQQDKRAINLDVDLSQPGEYASEFDQSWGSCHGQTIDLALPTAKIKEFPRENLFENLKFTWRITDTGGNFVTAGSSSDEDYLYDASDEESIMLIYFRSIPRGKYMFNLCVIKGEPSLAGIEQRLSARYRPCGLETLVAVFLFVFGGVSLLIGAVIIIIVVNITRRRRKCGQLPESGNLYI